ncbi:MAG: hypothetical protein KDK30_18015 [Leptospiraceae bacterium]|nr:hypothetical protein [Leptospiraceae bacterium]
MSNRIAVKKQSAVQVSMLAVPGVITLCLLLSGCFTATSLTAKNTTVPVLVGPVRTIGGSPTPGADADGGESFEITSEHYRIYSSGGSYSSTVEADDGVQKFDVELIKKTPANLKSIYIDEIQVETYQFHVIFSSRESSKTVIRGRITEQAGGR